MGDGDHARAQHLHTGDVRRLLCNVDLAHVDVALKPEICRRSRERNAVLSCAGLGNELLFAHVLRKQSFAHAVVQLVRAGMIEILALEVDLAFAEQF